MNQEAGRWSADGADGGRIVRILLGVREHRCVGPSFVRSRAPRGRNMITPLSAVSCHVTDKHGANRQYGAATKVKAPINVVRMKRNTTEAARRWRGGELVAGGWREEHAAG